MGHLPAEFSGHAAEVDQTDAVSHFASRGGSKPARRIVAPEPPSWLSEAPLSLAKVSNTWFRFSPKRYPSPIFWSCKGIYRFDSPDARSGVCYLASSIVGALLEVFGDKITYRKPLDLDIPLYFRRIKSVALTLPCVTGPYTSVNCTLTLQKSSIRISTDIAEGYARKGPDDPRFSDYYGTVQSIVTSSAQSDSGLFETNLQDRRYLPFEYAGIAGSQWRVTLPADVFQFDFDTIADVVLHVRYTAREGGDAFKAAASANLQALINKAQTVGSVRLLSVRHEFPSAWTKFRSIALGQAGSPPTAELQLALVPELYPFWAQNIIGSASVKAVEIIAEMLRGDKSVTVNVYDKPDKTGNSDVLAANPSLGRLLSGSLTKIALPPAVSDAAHRFTLYFDDNSMEDLWLAITWGKSGT